MKANLETEEFNLCGRNLSKEKPKISARKYKKKKGLQTAKSNEEHQSVGLNVFSI